MAIKISKKIKGYNVVKPDEAKPAVSAPVAAEPELATAEVIQMHEKVERPDELIGATYKIKSPLFEHALYVTINDIVLNQGTEHERHTDGDDGAARAGATEEGRATNRATMISDRASDSRKDRESRDLPKCLLIRWSWVRVPAPSSRESSCLCGNFRVLDTSRHAQHCAIPGNCGKLSAP